MYVVWIASDICLCAGVSLETFTTEVHTL